MKKPSYRAIADRREDGENAIDRVIAHRTKSKRRDRELARASAAIVEALGDRRALWFEYEAPVGDRTIEREAVAFDLGVEHGRAAERANRLGPALRAIRVLVEQLRTHALGAGLPNEDAVGALVLATWAVLGARAHRPSPNKKGHQR
jgi:hypothetical protein